MSYHTVLLMGENQEVEGIFSIQTSVGHVVLVAEKTPRFAEFLDLAAQMVEPAGKKVGFVDLQANSFQGAVNQLLQMDPSLSGTALFVDQDDSLFQDILLQLRESFGS